MFNFPQFRHCFVYIWVSKAGGNGTICLIVTVQDKRLYLFPYSDGRYFFVIFFLCISITFLVLESKKIWCMSKYFFVFISGIDHGCNNLADKSINILAPRYRLFVLISPQTNSFFFFGITSRLLLFSLSYIPQEIRRIVA